MRGFGRPPSADQMLQFTDKNKDGKLTKDELPEPMWDRLSSADKDKDGTITRDELEAHLKSAHGPGRPDTDKPADKPADKPVDRPADKPTDKPDEKPADKPAEEKPKDTSA